MLNQILDYLEKIQRVLATIHFDIIVEVIVNIVILGILFKAVDIFENKMKKKFTDKKAHNW